MLETKWIYEMGTLVPGGLNIDIDINCFIGNGYFFIYISHSVSYLLFFYVYIYSYVWHVFLLFISANNLLALGELALWFWLLSSNLCMLIFDIHFALLFCCYSN